jgi:uncharacterized protein (DUF1778 family)
VEPVIAGQIALKDQRLNIRASAEVKSLVEEAARASHMSASEFVLQAALRSAEEVLSSQTRFALPPEQWDEFTALLERPARSIPGLNEAADKPSPFSER